MNPIKHTGGARIGKTNATWPFATLTANEERLDLNATILGNFSFTPQDIVTLEEHNEFGNKGIRINHKVEAYNEKIIFWTNDPIAIINAVQSTFMNGRGASAPTIATVRTKQQQGGFPIKMKAALLLFALWNMCFLYDFYQFFIANTSNTPIGNGGMSALAGIVGVSILTLVSRGFRKLILKPGRELNDVKVFVYFLLFIACLMLVSFFFLFNFITH